MIYVDRTKCDQTKSVALLKFRGLRVGRTRVTARQLEADAAATGGVVPERVAGKHAATSPAVNELDVRGSAGRPAGMVCFSPGKQPDVRDAEVSSVAEFVSSIKGNWRRGVDAFMNVGRLCAEANARLTIAQKSALTQPLPFGNTAFSKFVQIGSDSRLYAPEIQVLLPPHYTTLYAVTLLTDEELNRAIADKVPDTTRAQLHMWHRELPRKMELAPKPNEAESDTVGANLPATSTQDAVQSGALPSALRTEQLAAAPASAPAPETVATGSPSTPPPNDEIPPFLDRRPLSADNQRAYDAIAATWIKHVVPLWNRASAVVRERIIAEVIRANPSG
jgi:hypothetical protein